MKGRTPCTFPGCGRPNYGKGLCGPHRDQKKRGLELRPIGFKRVLQPNPELPNTLLVPLTRGKVAIVDESDGEAVGRHNWVAHLDRRARTFYAQAWVDGRVTTLHIFLWRVWRREQTPEIDHKNGDGLDCRRENLRAATWTQNQWNRAVRSDSTTGLKGVSPTASGMYRARIQVDGRRIVLGVFSTAEAASEAYDRAARQHHGAFARPTSEEATA